MSLYTVRRLDKEAFPEWDDFVLNRPAATLFQTTTWLEAVTPETAEVEAVYEGQQLIAGWALSRNRRLGFTRLLQPPLTPYQAPVFAEKISDTRKETLARQIADRFQPFDVLQCTAPPAVRCAAFCHDEESIILPHQTSRIHANRNPDNLLESYSKGVRNEIRRARRDGLKTRFDTPPGEVLRLARLSMRHAERSFPLDEAAFQHLVTALKKQSMARTVGIQNDVGKYIAAQLLVHDRHTTYNLVFGVDRQAESPYAGALLMHSAIEWSLQNGRTFDFEGSSLQGVQQFYNKFNPSVVELQTCTYPRTSRIRWAQRLLHLFGKHLY